MCIADKPHVRNKRKKMASSRSILVYWIKENNWSILKETCIKEGSLTKGSVVQAYYLRKVDPAILIAISENKSSIERIEAHFKKFLLGVDPHVDEEEERIKKIKNEFIPSMTDTPLLSTPKKLTPKKSAANPEMATPKKIAPKKLATPKKTTPEKTTPNKSSKMDGLVPQKKGSNEETDYLRKETEINNSRDRRIRKLEDDVNALKEDIKYLRRKVRKLEDRNSLQEVNEVQQQSSAQDIKQSSADGECSSVSAQQEDGIDDIKKSVKHLKCDQDVFKVLCLKIFTKDELKNSSRTGKKTIKCGDTARPPLDVEKLTKLELLVLQCTTMDKDLFYKKLENLQKVLRRS